MAKRIVILGAGESGVSNGKKASIQKSLYSMLTRS